tara:strand:- start:893 stop:1141 length:249 start_codon:yes stop_codon:yes gene_type:complete
MHSQAEVAAPPSGNDHKVAALAIAIARVLTAIKIATTQENAVPRKYPPCLVIQPQNAATKIGPTTIATEMSANTNVFMCSFL